MLQGSRAHYGMRCSATQFTQSPSLMLYNYSKIATEYDQRNADAIVQLERGIRERIPFIGVKQEARLLDYACGTGMLSRVRVSPPRRDEFRDVDLD